jgi:hypothetical protein
VVDTNQLSLTESVPLLISILALGVSGTTLWLSHLRQGYILMTKPTIFFFGWDIGIHPKPKIFLRSLLFSTASNGRVLENLYLNVKSPHGQSVFSFWGHTMSDSNRLVPGSGLFVGKNGFSANHHFNPDLGIDLEDPYPMGEYEIEVIARQFGDTVDRKLGRFVLKLDQEMSNSLKEKVDGVIWLLAPSDQSYYAEHWPRGQNEYGVLP